MPEYQALVQFRATGDQGEVHEAALQFVRKVSGFNRPSHSNEAVFHEAVEDIEKIVRTMLKRLETNAPPKDREVVAAKARERAKLRFPATASA